VIELLRSTGTHGDPRVVHRLDAETSGVLLIARGIDSQRALVRQFAERQVEKAYLAIVRGRPAAERGVIDRPIAVDLQHPDRMRIGGRGSKAAMTEWELLESWAGLSLLRCRPRTGRTHQIRVHLAHAGTPLAVDALYGSGEGLWLSQLKPGYHASRRHEEHPLIARLTLHAGSLRFVHPADGRQVHVEAEPPKDFRATLNQLRKLG
jgi:RluA family pseudouridine synthase